MCQTHTMCTVFYVCCLIEFSQQTALGRLFNYCHFADGVIGLQRREMACLGSHGSGFKAPCLPSTSLKPAMALPQKASRPEQTFPALLGSEICAKGDEAEQSCKRVCPGWEWAVPVPTSVPVSPPVIPVVGSG